MVCGAAVATFLFCLDARRVVRVQAVVPLIQTRRGVCAITVGTRVSRVRPHRLVGFAGCTAGSGSHRPRNTCLMLQRNFGVGVRVGGGIFVVFYGG